MKGKCDTAIGYMGKQFKIKIQIREIYLGFIRLQIVFLMDLDELRL